MKKIFLTFIVGVILFLGANSLPGTARAQTCGGENQVCCTTGSPCNDSSLTCQRYNVGDYCVKPVNRTQNCYGNGRLGNCCAEGATCVDGSICNSTTKNWVCDLPSNCGDLGKTCCTGITKCFYGVCAGDNTCTNNPESRTGVNNSSGSSNTGNNEIHGSCGDDFINTAIGCIPISNSNALIGFILKWGLGIGGGIAFLLILVAGFQIMTSRGDPNRLKAGQELMTSAIAGILLLIFSLIILRIIGFDILKIGFFK